MNFVEFSTKYKVTNKKLQRQPDNVVPRIFPTYSCNPKGSNYHLYCKYQLLRYKPWKKTQNNAWNDQEGYEQLYIDSWQNFLNTEYGQTCVPNWIDQLQNVIESNQEISNQPLEQHDQELEEWMILSNLRKPFESENSYQPDYNWHLDRVQYSEQQIDEMPTWIKIHKEQFAEIVNEHNDFVDVNSFSEMQRLAYDIVNTHFENASEKEPLLLIVVGLAGTGKSYLIKALRNLLQTKCVVTATTGKASFNIKGVTIHSLLKLPIGIKNEKDLTGETLNRMQDNLANTEYILIDEYSMLGQTTFGWIDKRCKQATGLHNKVLGGKPMILIGDSGQLPPVADKPLYHNNPSTDTGEQGYYTYRMFDKVVKLTVNQRVQGESSEQKEFRDLLSRLRNGNSTLKDWELLLNRSPNKVSNLAEFEDATRLFYNNEDVANYNNYKLKQPDEPVACIEACHSSAFAKNISADDMNGLSPILFLAKNAKVMLTMNLWSSVGLCNGATGKVVDFIYHYSVQPPNLPIAVIVQFDDYRGQSINGKPNCVPICPVTVTTQSNDTFHERQQLPLRLAWSVTIHKSQGLTLPKAVIDIGRSERSPGTSYVAVSRVKSLSSCVIEPMTFERLTSLKSSGHLQRRLEEEERLDLLAEQTLRATAL